MSRCSLERLIGTAVVDPRFCDALIRGRRAEALLPFELTLEEKEAVLGIEAETLQDFARYLDGWLSHRNGTRPPVYSVDEARVPWREDRALRW